MLKYDLSRVKNSVPVHLQVNLVIRGWTANTEFADKKTHFD